MGKRGDAVLMVDDDCRTQLTLTSIMETAGDGSVVTHDGADARSSAVRGAAAPNQAQPVAAASGRFRPRRQAPAPRPPPKPGAHPAHAAARTPYDAEEIDPRAGLETPDPPAGLIERVDSLLYAGRGNAATTNNPTAAR